MEVFRAREGQTGTPYSFRTQLHVASATGSQKITIPKVFGMEQGEWITFSLMPVGSNDA